MKTDSQSICGIGSWSWWGVALSIALVLAVSVSGCKKHPRTKLTPGQELSVFEGRLRKSGHPDDGIADILKPNARKVLMATLEMEKEYLKRDQRREASGSSFREELACFREGCMQQITFANRAAASALIQSLIRDQNAPIRAWPGAAYFGPLVDRPEGGATTTWALLIQPTDYELLRGSLARADNVDPSRSPAAAPPPPSTNVVLNVGKEDNQ